MKKFLLSLLLFTGAAFAVPESPDQLKKIEDEFRLACDTYGEPSCISRFTAMAGCTFVFAMNSGETTQEALDIADELFTSVMRGNKIGIEAMFLSKDLVKPEIRSEAIERINYVQLIPVQQSQQCLKNYQIQMKIDLRSLLKWLLLTSHISG